ncbi:MAG: hypothetical protein MH137_11065 [Flavobacteriales bacterium]|nr:hypothetical protein [Flavobacteriales bacterium]
MNKNLTALFTVCICLFVVSCGSPLKESGKTQVAVAGGKTLYLEDLDGVVPQGASSQDSLLFVQSYIRNWVEEQLLIEEAKADKNIDFSEIEERVEEYRNTLIYYAHLNNLMQRDMDTTVSEPEMLAFYEENKAGFELKENILKVNYVILPNSLKKTEKAKKLFFAGNYNDNILKEFCRDAAYSCQLADSSWISFDAFSQIIPVDRTQSPELLLRMKKNLEIQDTVLGYWVKIHDYKIKESISPFEFVRDEIRLILLNRRKNEFLMNYRKKLFDEGIENRKVEIYNP